MGWGTQNKFFYLEKNGFTDNLDGTTNPASLKVGFEGKDVDNNDLTNPKVGSGRICGGATYSQPRSPLFIMNDCNYTFFTPASNNYDYSDFDGGSLDGWNVSNNTGTDMVGVNDNNSFKLTQSTNGTVDSYPKITKSLALYSGVTYKLQFAYRNADAFISKLYDGSNFIDVDEYLYGDGVWSYTLTMTANYNVYIYFDGLNYLNNITIDDIYIIDITDYADVVPKKLTIQEVADTNGLCNKMFTAITDRDSDVGNDIWYNTPQSVDNRNKIAICQAKITDAVFVTDPADGSLATDEDGDIIIDNI